MTDRTPKHAVRSFFGAPTSRGVAQDRVCHETRRERNAHSVDVDADTPLLWCCATCSVCPATKFGCGIALCGACTVHVDGVPARSCVTPSGESRQAITTIEAVSSTPQGKALQKAGSTSRWWQCGYCQSGQIMSAARCSPTRRSRAMRTSTQPCPVTSADAAPISESGPQSTRPG